MYVCMSLSLSDYYANRNNTTQIVPHFRDSKSDDVEAAFAAIDLLKNVEVQAILGPQESTEADFITDLGMKVKVPIISSATSPSLSPTQNPYFVRVAYCSCWQAKAIAAIVKAFGWREVVFIYEDSNFGSGILPHLTDAMMEIGVSVPDQSVLSPSADDDQIMVELLKLKTKQTRVFIVHLPRTFASKFFLKVKEAGMMSSGYVWIITDAFTSLLVSMDPSVLGSLQGVIGVKPYVPSSAELDSFTRRWKSKTFGQQHPDMDGVELNVFGLWAYDSVTALATALEKVGTSGLKFNRRIIRENSTDLDAIGTSGFGPLLLESIQNIKIRGLSGDFHIVDGELQPSAFQIVNVEGREKGIGFWTEKNGISKNPNPDESTVYSANKGDLGEIMWPGYSSFLAIFRTMYCVAEKRVSSKLSRFVMIVWMLMVLILIASYTASFASLLTVQQLQPTVSDVKDLIKNGKYIGCQNSSFVAGKLKNVFGTNKIRYYSTLEEYDEALSKGSENGGVDAVMDELPYLRLLLRKYRRSTPLLARPIIPRVLDLHFRRGLLWCLMSQEQYYM